MIDQMQTDSPPPALTSTVQLTLLPVRSSDQVCAVSVEGGLLTIGSDDACDLRLSVAGIEPQHCRIQVDGDAAMLVAESRMTWLNDGPVRRQQLRHGDRLAVGPVEFAVQLKRITRPATVPRPSSADEADDHHPPNAPSGVITVENIDELLADLVTRPANGGETTDDDAPLRSPETLPTERVIDSPAKGFGPVDAPSSPDVPKSLAATTRALQKARATFVGHEMKLAQMERALVELDQQRSQLQTVLDDLLNESTTATQTHQREDEQLQRRRVELCRLENEANLWQASLRERQAHTDRLQAELQRRIADLEIEESRVCTQRSELDLANETLAAARRDLFEREAALQSRAEHLNESEAALAEREATLRHASDTLDQRTGEWDQHLAEVSSLRAEIERQQHERDVASAEWSAARLALDNELSQLRDESARKDAAHDELQRHLEVRTSDLRDAISRIEAQQEALDDAQARLAELADRHAEAERQQSTVEQQQQTLKERERELSEQQRALDEREAELTRQAEQAAERERELARREEELADHREAAVLLDGELSQQREAALAEIAASREELDRRRGEFGPKFEQLTRDRATLRDDQQACDVLRTNLLARQQELEAADQLRQQQLNELQADQQRLLADHDALQAERDELQSTHTQLLEERTSLADEVDELRRQLDVIREQAEAQPSEPRQRLEDLEADYRQLLAARDELRNEHDELRSRHVDVERERSELQEQLESLRIDLQSARRELAMTQASPHDEPTASCPAGNLAARQDHVLENDEFELVDDMATEALDTDGDDEQADEAVLALRSQMAQMFGIGADELTSTARRRGREPAAGDVASSALSETDDDQDVEPAGESLADVVPDVPMPTPTVHLDADDPDSVAAYMRNLLARNRGGRVDPEPVAPPAPRPRPTPPPVTTTKTGSLLESFKKAETAEDTTRPAPVKAPTDSTCAATLDATVEATRDDDVVEEQEPPQPERSRPTVDLERQHYDSFRELANRSARMAVAKHNSTALKNTLLIQGIVAAACLAATLVMLTSPMWSAKNYATWGGLTSVLTALMVWKLLETSSQMQYNRLDRKRQKTQASTKAALAAESIPESAEPPVSNAPRSDDEPQPTHQHDPAPPLVNESEHVTSEHASNEDEPAAEEAPPKYNPNLPTLAFEDVIPH